MLSTNATVQDSDYIDYDSNVKFKLPSESFVSGSYRVYGEYYRKTGKPSRHVTLRFEQELPSSNGVGINYERFLESDAAIEDTLNTILEREQQRDRQNEILTQLTVEVAQVLPALDNQTFHSIRRASFKTKYTKDTIYVEEIRTAIKHGFIFSCRTVAEKDRYRTLDAENLCKGMIDSFSPAVP